jgi:hypothetical protein
MSTLSDALLVNNEHHIDDDVQRTTNDDDDVTTADSHDLTRVDELMAQLRTVIARCENDRDRLRHELRAMDALHVRLREQVPPEYSQPIMEYDR